MSNKLTKLTLNGFKTIKKMTDFEPSSLTVLIGPNGAGKSNFISFFRMLSWAMQPPGNLQIYMSELGGASTILHDGPSKTHEIEAEMTFRTEAGENQYNFRLVFSAGDTLIFADERYRFSREEPLQRVPWKSLGAGHRESNLIVKAMEGDTTASVIHSLLRRLIIYQFHNTSPTARMRTKWNVEDNRFLKEDGANIAPFLLRLREKESKSYQLIVETIRLILPFFADFELEADWNSLLLSWREQGTDQVFNASQAADGMLRVIALVTLLLQPDRNLPDVLILDEPELGLHPYAINVISGLLKSLSVKKQVIVATQSMPFIDYFNPEDIVVVDRKGRESQFRRLDAKNLAEWLEDYSLSELWEKNVIGGRPI